MAVPFLGTARPLSRDGFDRTLQALGVEAASLWALLTVETRGFGYMPDRRPKILFERHIFHRRTQGRFDAKAPDVSSPAAGGYQGGTKEYARLQQALALERRAALESASWGLGQIMGFNAARVGYADAEAMVAAFCASEDQQLDAVARFITANPALLAAFQRRDWAKVAFFYNGKAYAERGYDLKLARYHDLYAGGAVPDIDVRQAQARLTYLGYDPGGVDGVLGNGCRVALIGFQKACGVSPAGGELDDPTRSRLETACGV